MSREISLSGGDISVIKALGISGGQVSGKTLMERIAHMEPAELLDTLDTLMTLDYVQSDLERLRSVDDLKEARFNVNGAMMRDIREAITPQKKEVKPTRQRRG